MTRRRFQNHINRLLDWNADVFKKNADVLPTFSNRNGWLLDWNADVFDVLNPISEKLLYTARGNSKRGIFFPGYRGLLYEKNVENVGIGFSKPFIDGREF